MAAAQLPWAAGVAALAGDESGRMFAVARSVDDPGVSLVLIADAYPAVFGSQNTQESSVDLSGIKVSQVVATSPPIDFDVTGAAASSDGHALLLTGVRAADDTPVLAIVDLYGSQPLPGDGSSSTDSSLSSARRRLASLLFVHSELFARRPSLRVLQASWHPSSSAHFAALTSDGCWRLYHSARLEEPEQSFALRLPGTRGSIGLRRGPAPRATAFAFAPPGRGWASLAVLLLSSDGAIYCLCPVAPFGMRASATALQHLLEEATGTARSWLLAAFLSMLSPDSDTVCARPHVLETAAPALQGPLNAGLDSLRDASRGSDACALALSVPVVSGRAVVVAGTHSSSSSSGGSVCALLSGFSSGSVYAHALELSQLLPAWHDATPQCAYSVRGEVAAVRYDCEAVPLLPAASAAADRAAAAEQDGCSVPGAPLLLSPLLLLDVLHVNLQAVDAQQGAGDGGDDGDGRPHGAAAAASSRPPQAATRRRSRGTTGTAAWAAADSDEESDAGYDPDLGGGGGGSAGPLSLVSGSSGAAGAPAAGWPGARAAAAAAAAGALAPYPHGGGGFGVQDGDDDDDDDDCDARLSELRRVVLHAAPELPGRFWVVHDQGVWGVNVRWLPMLLDWLAAAEQGGSVGMHALRAQTGTLPPPALQELLLTPGGVAATAVVGSSLLGSGCVVLEAGDGGGLLLLRPRPAGVLGPHQGDGSTAMDGTTATDMQCAADAVDDAAASAGAVTALSAQLAAAATLSADERDARARLEDFYADVARGPRRAAPPQPPANLASLSAADPAGLSHISAMASWLLRTHVQYATGAHADMLERMGQLHEEAAEQAAAVDALRTFASSLTARQEELAERLARLGDASSTLSERGNLLAGLHWRLPRPPSNEERQLQRQLDVWEQRRDQARASWRALRARLDAYVRAAAAERPPPSPLQQPAARGSGFLGVPALAAGRAAARPTLTAVSRAGGGGGGGSGDAGGVTPGGGAPPSQLDKLRTLLQAQNDAITTARGRLDELCTELAVWKQEHPDMVLPRRLRSHLTAA